MFPAYFVDVWTLGHFGLWMGIGFAAHKLWCPPFTMITLLGLVTGLWWEVVEEGIVEIAIGFREPWFNRWVTDVAVDILGALAGASVSLFFLRLRGRRRG